MKTYHLKGKEYIELMALLQVTECCDSGGEAKWRISEGEVKVNGEVELRKRFKTRAGCMIEIDGHKIQVEA